MALRFLSAVRCGEIMHESEIFEADDRLSELLDRVEAGEEVLITRHGRVVASRVPPRQPRSDRQAQGAAAAIREMSRGVTLGGLSLRDLVNEGRK
jgi:antitoxin (DNA-binding transcriptional repressor) of toxin-antitoxin stability system